MSLETYFSTLQVLAALAIAVWWFYGPWQRLIVDTVRQRLFVIRDELFIQAADGKLGFDHAGYRATREWLNSAIQFAHEARWQHVVAARLAGAHLPKDALCGMLDGETNEEVRTILTKAYRRAVTAIALAMLLRSFSLTLATMLMLPIVIFEVLLKGRKPRPVSAFERAVEADLANCSLA